MNRWLLRLTTALPLIVLAEQAQAGPLMGIAGIIGGILSGASIATTVLNLALGVGMSLLQQAIAGEPEKPKPVGIELQIKVGDDQPVSTTIGLTATTGKLKYVGTYGDIGGTPNALVTFAVELGNLPTSGNPLGLWVDDQKVTPLWDEPQSIRGYPIKEFRKTKDGENTDYGWIRFHDGTQTAADNYLLSKFGNDSKRPYTDDMIGYGCPYAVMSFRYNRKFFKQQPQVLFETAPIPLYDIRKDSTNGGNGPQRWNDQSTWEPSYNLGVMAYNVVRGLRYKGEWFYGGQDIAAHRLPADSWIAAINECSRLITRPNGDTEPQFRGGLEITGNTLPKDVLEEFRKAMNGRFVDSAGKMKVSVGAYGAAVFAFTDEDLLVTQGQGFDPFPASDQTVNGLNATYPEPKQKWTAKDAPPLRDPVLEARDGQLLPKDMQFRAVSHNPQVQRLMRAALKEEQRFRRHQVWLPPIAWLLEPGIDVVAWTSEKNGYNAKKFIVTELERDDDFNCLVTLQEIDPSDYDWDKDFELPSSTGWIGKISAASQIMQGWSAEPAVIYDASGKKRRPAIRVFAAGRLDDVARVQVKVRLKANPDAIIFSSDQYAYDDDVDAPSWIVDGSWCLGNSVYQVQGKLIPFSTRDTEVSDWIDVLTEDIRFSAEDLHLDEVQGEILSDLVQLDAWLWQDSAIRDLQQTSQQLAKSLAEQDLANFADKQELRQLLISKTGKMSASFTQQITLATSQTEALASQVTYITAGLDGIGGATGLVSLVQRVTQQGETLTSQSNLLQSVSADLNTKASSNALLALSGTVTQQGQKIDSQANLLAAVTSQVGDFSADARIRFETYSTGVSGYAKIGLQAKVGNGDDFRTAGFFSYVPIDPGTPPRFVVNAGQFAVSVGIDDIGSAFFLVDPVNGLSINNGFIANLSTNRIKFEDGSVLTSALGTRAAAYVNAQATVDTFNLTNVFQNRIQADITKAEVDAVTVFADCRITCTSLAGQATAAVLYEIWEVENGGSNVTVAQGRLTFDTTGADGLQTGFLYYARRQGTGAYSYKLVLKKLNTNQSFVVGRCTITPNVNMKAS